MDDVKSEGKAGGEIPVLELSGLFKSFDKKPVLVDIGFEVKKGEIFALLGPNGAGKTTMIRIILDIFRPDSGMVSVLGAPFSEETKNRIGYLPEEGGIDKKLKLWECIRFFASLKGMADPDPAAETWLSRMNLSDYRNKKVSELSKGMSRRLQFIIAVIHTPEILILDEPFYGLDPVNKKLIKDTLLELNREGMTIIMSTHQMDEVERMCDRLLMLNRGKIVLYGGINEIRESFGYSVSLDYEGVLPEPDDGKIVSVNDYKSHAELVIKSGADTQDILKELVDNVRIKKFEVGARSLNDIFIEVAEDGQ
jgi:ABC-2 type transport system ATP-binding protein